MATVAHAACVEGVAARLVQVEVQIGRGLPGIDIVGLPERGVRESKVRVRAALDAEGFAIPPRHVVINLAPGDLRKTGSGFDLAIAAAMLGHVDAASGDKLPDTLLIGELGLDGSVRGIRGVLPQLLAARRVGLRRAVIPTENASDGVRIAQLICSEDFEVFCAAHLHDVVAWLNSETELPAPSDCLSVELRTPTHDAIDEWGQATKPPEDLADLKGQASARRALEVAAAGGHHLLLVGPPGAGKTMLARRLRSILPCPDPDELLEIATIASVAGDASPVAQRLEEANTRLGATLGRPFRAPHHSASTAALIGGGDPVRPGELTLAHRGVLFLDELPEFRRDVIESLRTALELGHVTLARARARVTLPSAPMVVAAMNPCPCGYATDRTRVCVCGPEVTDRYRRRVSGPLLDRFDMHVHVPRVHLPSLRQETSGESSATVAARVRMARDRARARGPQRGVEMWTRTLATDALSLLDRAAERLRLSARGYLKTIRVARTIADLAGQDTIDSAAIAEAIQYRVLDRDLARGDVSSVGDSL